MPSLPPDHNRKTSPVRVRFYLDGLNFYYGVSLPYNFKWIDLVKLLRALVRQRVPNAEVEKVIIFTAEVPVGNKRKDQPKRDRQANYLNALKAQHSSRIEIVSGMFKRPERDFEVAKGDLKGQTFKGRFHQEKQSDVNLAVRMVKDAYEAPSDFEIACLVSNDMDLAPALKLKKELGQRVLLITPRTEKMPEAESRGFQRRGISRELAKILVQGKPHNAPLRDFIHKIPELIHEVPRDLVLKHPLPDRVRNKYTPPDAEGWSIHQARKRG